MIKPAEKLKQLRKDSGHNPSAVAMAVGISDPEYYDFENSNDLEDCCSLGNLKALALLFRIPIAGFFSEIVPNERLSPMELAALIVKMMNDRKIMLAEAEHEIGWTLGPFLASPESAILTWNMTCLRDVCKNLNCSWISTLNGIEDLPMS